MGEMSLGLGVFSNWVGEVSAHSTGCGVLCRIEFEYGCLAAFELGCQRGVLPGSLHPHNVRRVLTAQGMSELIVN